jgi:hypothetical protein
MTRIVFLMTVVSLVIPRSGGAQEWVEYPGGQGPGAGKHIVLVSGDEEYRSEEALPMLGKILAVRHGFRCTVLFSVNPETGTIDPTNQTNIPGFEKIGDADLVIMLLRFREVPDEQMKHLVEHLNAGKPILALRTSTHAFDYSRNADSPFAKYGWKSDEWQGGFGKHVLGETWVNHHGQHGKESARGLINGIGVKDLPADTKVLIYGQVLQGMQPTDPPNYHKSIMPMIWQRDFGTETGNAANILCSTIGAATDLESADLRRLLVNYCYWSLGLGDKISPQSNVDYVGKYEPSNFGFNGWKRGVKPADHELK